MVFSIFRKDKGKPVEPARRLPAAPASRAGTCSPEGAAARSRSVTSKIDAIESEMALSGGPSAPAGGSFAPTAPLPAARDHAQAPAGLEQGARSASAATHAPTETLTLPQSDAAGTADHPADAMSLEIGTSGIVPVIEEAAILYANEQDEPAAELLRQAVAENQMGGATLQAWLMLLDLYQFSGRKEAFESLAIEYAARFERSPPTWRDGEVARPVDTERNAPGARAAIVLPALVDAGVSRQLDAIGRALQRARGVTIDCRNVRATDADGAALLHDAIARLTRGSQQAVFVAPDRLADAARAIVQAGRRDDQPGGWLLWMDALRLMDAQAAFEDASIDYCVTYEVSPPPWEPMPAHVRRDDAAGAGADMRLSVPPVDAAWQDGAAPRADAFVLAGEIAGAMDVELAALNAHAERHAHVFVDCRHLRRLDFAAAGQLLNAVTGLRAAGRSFEFDQPNHMVAALLMVMGVHQLAAITTRRP